MKRKRPDNEPTFRHGTDSSFTPHSPALMHALQNDAEAVNEPLELERHAEMAADKAYWAPLRELLKSLKSRS